MLPIAEALQGEDIRYLIPQAAMNRWYPKTAFGPLEANQPDLTSALERVHQLVSDIQHQQIGTQQIVLGGFSQGACLAAEYAVCNPDRYGGVFVFSGALIGPPGTIWKPKGDFKGMPVFIGGSDVDPWIDHALMTEMALVFEDMGAEVDFQTYPGMAHTINEDQIRRVRMLLETVKSSKED
jgi:predicted esterase